MANTEFQGGFTAPQDFQGGFAMPDNYSGFPTPPPFQGGMSDAQAAFSQPAPQPANPFMVVQPPISTTAGSGTTGVVSTGVTQARAIVTNMSPEEKQRRLDRGRSTKWVHTLVNRPTQRANGTFDYKLVGFDLLIDGEVVPMKKDAAVQYAVERCAGFIGDGAEKLIVQSHKHKAREARITEKGRKMKAKAATTTFSLQPSKKPGSVSLYDPTKIMCVKQPSIGPDGQVEMMIKPGKGKDADMSNPENVTEKWVYKPEYEIFDTRTSSKGTQKSEEEAWIEALASGMFNI